MPPAFHGVHLPRLDDDVRPATLAAGGTWPNAFTIAQHAKGNSFTTAAYYSWPPLAQLLPRATLNASVLATCTNCDDCLRVEPTLVADYVSALRTRRFGLSWLYVDALDECGHARAGQTLVAISISCAASTAGWARSLTRCRRGQPSSL